TTEFYIDGVKIDGHTFKTAEVKEFTVYGMIGDKKSSELKFSSIKISLKNKDFVIKLNKTSLIADNTDVMSFSAEQNSKDCTDKAHFYIDGVKIDGHTFKTTEVKEFTVYAMIADKKSAEHKFSSIKTDSDKKNLLIKLNKASILADNTDVIIFSAVQDSKDCTDKTQFYIDGKKIVGNTFKTSEVKEFAVYGMIVDKKSAVHKFSSIKIDSKKKYLLIKLSKTSILADNTDVISFSAEQDSKDCTDKTHFYVDGVKIVGHTFKTSEVKEFTVYGIKEEVKSIESKFSSKGIVDISYKFVHKVIVEDYTATWCPWCPWILNYLDKYKSNEFFIPIAVHDDYLMKSKHTVKLLEEFPTETFPRAIVNRVASQIWRGEKPKTYIKDKAPLAIALRTSVDGSNAKIDLKILFDKEYKFKSRLKVVIMLLEDDIIANQDNAISGKSGYEGNMFYDLPNPIKNFHHNDVLRSSATNIMGDLIPDEFVTNRSEYKKSYTLDISKYKAKNCHIVAFINQEDSQKKLGVLNAQRVKLGESIFY
ncbi:MAG: Omp28-related outer membrane protein, partial [Marinifilaceae bacterium]